MHSDHQVLLLRQMSESKTVTPVSEGVGDKGTWLAPVCPDTCSIVHACVRIHTYIETHAHRNTHTETHSHRNTRT